MLIFDGGFCLVFKYVEIFDVYQLDVVLLIEIIVVGDVGEIIICLFVGVKEWDVIVYYQNNFGLFVCFFGVQVDFNIEFVECFFDVIDWGWFFFLMKLIFILLYNFNFVINNMGWLIVVLMVVIKIIVLLLVYKLYVLMVKMKEFQLEMEKLKELVGDDCQKFQQGMMKFYKDNKVNLVFGCLLILIQILIFFLFYKVIFNMIELW